MQHFTIKKLRKTSRRWLHCLKLKYQKLRSLCRFLPLWRKLQWYCTASIPQQYHLYIQWGKCYFRKWQGMPHHQWWVHRQVFIHTCICTVNFSFDKKFNLESKFWKNVHDLWEENLEVKFYDHCLTIDEGFSLKGSTIQLHRSSGN